VVHRLDEDLPVTGGNLRLPLARPESPPQRRLPLLGTARPIDRTIRPTYAVWEVTLLCDLACTHCSSRAGRARPDELSTAEALDLVDQLAALGVREVTLIGGEVYLRKDWESIVAAISAHGMDCSIVTGGRQMAKHAARARAAGVKSVSVSVDGLASTHDRLRAREGSFAAAIASLHALSEVGLAVSANTQIGRINRTELPALYDVLRTAGARSWQLQLTVAGGNVVDHPEILLEPYHLLDTMPAVASIVTRAIDDDVRIWPGNNFGYYGPHEHLIRRELPGRRKGSCGAGVALIGIESNGDVKGCPSLPTRDYVGGNVREARLVDIWERAASMRFARESRLAELHGHCATCYYAEDCHAGCSWTAHSLFGRRGDNPYCHHRALELFAKGLRERVELRERGEGTPFDHGKWALIEERWPADEHARAEAVIAGRERWLLR
jgi:radical SAM protein with 4Fe4S-binding SPASM domain